MKPSVYSIIFDEMENQFEHFEIFCYYRLAEW